MLTSCRARESVHFTQLETLAFISPHQWPTDVSGLHETHQPRYKISSRMQKHLQKTSVFISRPTSDVKQRTALTHMDLQ